MRPPPPRPARAGTPRSAHTTRGGQIPASMRKPCATTPLILEAAKKSGAGRLLCVGGAGTLFCAPGLRVVDSGAIPDAIMGGVRALGEFYLDTLMNERGIDWVFFSPAGTLEPGKRTGQFRLGKDDLIVDADGRSHISVEDYALAMVDELENPAHHYERFTIGY